MLHSFNVTLAAAGTRQALKASRTIAAWVQVQNNGTVALKLYVGDKTVSSAVPGVALNTLDAQMFPACSDINGYDLSTIFIDADTNGQVANVLYFTR